MLRLQREHGINSHLVVTSFANDENGRQAIAQHQSTRRSLDVAWQISAGGRVLLANLMPLAGERSVRAYLARVERGVEDPPGGADDTRGRAPAVLSLAGSDPLAALDRLIRGDAPC